MQAISLLEYLLKNGVATCVDEARDQIYYLRNLENFSVMDQGKERGQGGTFSCFHSFLVRDKVQAILAMVQDTNTMQLERQKARRLSKKFATTKSVGSAPAPAAPSAASQMGASVSQAASNAGNAVKGFFGNLGNKTPQFSGPSYRVKGGELADIPVSGQVMKPATPANNAASKMKSGLASFGQKVSGAVSSAYTSVSTTVQQHTATPAPA